MYLAVLLMPSILQDFIDGMDTDTLAERELDKYLLEVFEHPDALEGLTAMTERRFPEFNRTFPF